MRFQDRADAGRRLAERLSAYAREDPVVLALPRGGVPVGYEVARALSAPLEVVVARKIGAPFQPELGVGAVAEGGEPLIDEPRAQALGLAREDLDEAIAREREEVARRAEQYRGQRQRLSVEDRTGIVVDDGLATGVTAQAALLWLREQRPRRLVLAVPVCSEPTAERLRGIADEVVCLQAPPGFRAVGQAYDNFDQVVDQTVIDLLARARQELPQGG